MPAPDQIFSQSSSEGEMIDHVVLSRRELSQIVEETVKQTLTQMGVDTSNPIEMQQDFQYLRQWRGAVQDLSRKGILSIVLIAISGAISLFVLGAREWLRHSN